MKNSKSSKAASKSQHANFMQNISDRLRALPGYMFIAAGVLVIVIIVLLIFFFSGSPASTAGIDDGINYIKNLEKTDILPIEKQIKQIKAAERKAAMENGEVDVWKQFDDSAILGDSRAVGFYFYKFLDQSRVMAEAGATLRNIPGYLDQLKTLNPSTVFLCFGINDISIGFWPTVEDYIAELDTVIAQIQEALPEAKVFVNSIIPAIDPAFQKSEKWREIPSWNESIRAHCEENNILYVDITDTVNAHTDLYDIDGIHMKITFYDFWAIDMITEVYENEDFE